MIQYGKEKPTIWRCINLLLKIRWLSIAMLVFGGVLHHSSILLSFTCSWYASDAELSSHPGFWWCERHPKQSLLRRRCWWFIGVQKISLQKVFGCMYRVSKQQKTLLMFRNPKQPPGMYWNLVNSGKNCQPQLVIAGFLNHQQLSPPHHHITGGPRHASLPFTAEEHLRIIASKDSGCWGEGRYFAKKHSKFKQLHNPSIIVDITHICAECVDYLPTFTMKIHHFMYRYIYQSHGSYGYKFQKSL